MGYVVSHDGWCGAERPNGFVGLQRSDVVGRLLFGEPGMLLLEFSLADFVRCHHDQYQHYLFIVLSLPQSVGLGIETYV